MEQPPEAQDAETGALSPEKGTAELKPFRTTNMFFQRVLTLRQRILWLFLGNTVYGCAYGYYFSVQTTLQEQGATYKQQSLLSIAFYPYSFKFIVAPFLDRFYSYKLGRSKTYVLIGSLMNCILFIILAINVETFLKNKDVTMLMVMLLLITAVLCTIEIATDCWILTLFDEEHRPQATTYEYLGQLIGTTLAFNIFVPLNDVKWLNDNIYTENPIDTPLVSHYQICILVGVLYLIQFFVLLLFVAEEMYVNPEDAVTFTQVLQVFPRHFTNRNMLKFVLYMFCCRFFYYMIEPIFDLKIMANGYRNVRRSYVNNLDMLFSPVSFTLSYMTVYYLIPGNLIRLFHLTMMVVVGHGFFRYLTLMDLMENRDSTRALMARGLTTVVLAMDYSTYFIYAFFFNITNPKIGNTGMCCLAALLNQTWFLAQTVGLYLADLFEFEYLVPICLIFQALLLILLFGYSKRLDQMDPKLFDLSSDLPKDKKLKPAKQEKLTGKTKSKEGSRSFQLRMTE